MKTRYKILDVNGNSHAADTVLMPYEKYSAVMESIEFLPSTGDPEDPNDVNELVITLRVKTYG
jgi:hypothetical protein